MPHDIALLEHCERRRKAMDRGRKSWEPDWRELTRYIHPGRGAFYIQPNQGNRGTQKNQNILDVTPIKARRTLTAGLMGGLTSPARPWFRLTVPDHETAELAAVRAWFDDCADRMRMVFNSSNLYNVLPLVYDEVAVFGTACAVMVFDREDVIRLIPMTIGEYWIASNYRGRVDTLCRRFMKSYRQINEEWPKHGDTAIETKAKSSTEGDSEIAIIHLIEPNKDYDASRADAKGKKYRSVYYKDGASAGEILHESGFDEWNVLAPRWSTVGNDVWGRGPGHEALPDVKSLTVFTKRLHNAIDKHVNPPMGAHISLRGQPSSVLPGALNFFATNEKGAGMWPLMQTQPGSIEQIRIQIADTRRSIESIFFADMFLMISQMEGVQPRNTMEISVRKEEKMLMLGPVLEGLHDELLNPLIQWTFTVMQQHNLFKEPPEELHGYPLEVELISVLAQAQKAADLGAIERVAGFVGSLASTNPEILDKFDGDQAVDLYNEGLGGPTSIVVADDVVQKKRAARAQQQAQQAALANAGTLAQGAKTMSETEVGAGRNALQAITGL